MSKKQIISARPDKPGTIKVKVAQRKEMFLDALRDSLGIITRACDQTHIGRSTVYDWFQGDPEFRANVDDITNLALDFVESKLFENIENNDVASIIFFLKTKGKSRGYTERQEIEHDLKIPNRFHLIIKQDELTPINPHP